MLEGLPESTMEELQEEAENTATMKWLSLTIMISVSIALLDVMAAGVSLVENMTATKALLAKNEAALYQSKASDQWNFYESKVLKRSIAELGLSLAPPTAPPETLDKLKTNIDRYIKEGEDISAQAKNLEAKADEQNVESARIMERHHILSIGGGLLHVSVAIASVALIVRHRWFWHGGLVFGVMGVAIALWAMLSI